MPGKILGLDICEDAVTAVQIRSGLKGYQITACGRVMVEGQDGYEEALSREHAREMDFTGRPMKGYVFVDPPGFEEEDELSDWVERCYRFVQTLPPK